MQFLYLLFNMSLAHDLKMQRRKGYWTTRASRKQHLKKNAKSIVTMLVLFISIVLIVYSISSKDITNYLQSIFKPEVKIDVNR